MPNINEIQMRDPFVYAENGKYYLLGTTDKNCWHGNANGFEAYTGNDLKHFEFGAKLFSPSDSFWGTENFWAPELHKYKGEYYLFASFKSPGHRRATSILKSSGSPLGPYAPWGEETVTPIDWECLDGTLYVDENGQPYLVFCHEWVQEGGGTICLSRLRDDLSGPIGQAVTLFSAKDAPWTKMIRHSSGISGHVTDGPFLFRPANGQLYMLWSSISETGYAIGLSVSKSGSILGPWRHQDKPVYSGDGGHGMVFRDFDGQLRLAIHTPNRTPDERPIFLYVRETAEGLSIL